MSDFDEVLERLLADPEFQTALRRDPESALAGYHLAPDERQLLDAQLDLSPGEERTVEMRVSKSGVMGMVGPVFSALGMAASSGGGMLPRDEGGTGVAQTFGSVEDAQGVFGEVQPSGPDTGELAADYHTRVDADGDGHWDTYQAFERGDGGVDIKVDRNSDGVVDFVGHDYDRDGLVDDADYDKDFDGVLDTRMYDDDGDGWMDRSSRMPHPDQGTFGQAPAQG